MQKTGIEWADVVWNPQTGCLHNCNYSESGCYAKSMARYRKTEAAKQFLPEYHEDKLNDLNEILKGVVFAGSNGDMFGEWLPEAQVQCIVGKARSYWSVVGHEAAIMFLTKNPARYATSALPVLKQNRNAMQIWLGTTLDAGYTSKGWDESVGVGCGQCIDVHKDTPTVESRSEAISKLDYPRKWVSIEPLNFDYSHWCSDEILDRLSRSIGWVVIGTETHGGKPRPKGKLPDATDIWEIIQACRDPYIHIPVFVKDSIHQLWPGEKWPREFPAGVQLATKAAAWQP